jgi:DNA polymerase-3 subunit delta
VGSARAIGAHERGLSLAARCAGHNQRYILGMAASAERTLRKSIQTRTFERAYYLYGEDDFLKDDALRQLIASAVDPATRDFNLDLRDGASLDAETLGSLLGTPPMMAERRVVIVRNAPALRKDARAALDRFLARETPSADLLLVLVAPAGELAAADKTLAKRMTDVEFEPLSGDRVAKWIVHHAGALGVSLTPGAAELLQRAVGNDLPSLATELDKLASFSNGAPVDEEAVTAVVGVRRGETVGDLMDRVAARDTVGALAILPHILTQPKTSGVSIVMGLATQTLALAWGGAVKGRADYFGLLKESKAYPGRSWSDAAAAWQRAAGTWSTAQLDAALEALLAADASLKDTRGSTDEQLLTTLVLSLCA